MALSEATIKFNYQAALEKASELETQAGNLQSSVVDEIGTSVVAINRDWEGQNAAEYIAKCNTLKSNLGTVVSQMNSVAGAIRTMAKNVYDAEMEALRIAREREAAARAAREAAARQNAQRR